MTKINIFPIIRDHLASLRDAHSKNASFFDYFIFYLVPFVIALGAYCTKFVIDRESYSASITFFGIFIALLLNIQMAMFGIYQRKWEVDDDEISAVVDEQKIETRRVLLGEINANVSYLIVVC